MRIAIASGKGGTGKTTVAASLARMVSARREDVTYLDCDVEEPNGHLFLRPDWDEVTPVHVPVPEVDADACTGCGKCRAICQYRAISIIKRRVLLFPELCHGCGGCVRVCPVGAIREVGREVGEVRRGMSGALHHVQGLLHVGEAMSPPVIRAARASVTGDGVVLIDAPPGTACPVITAIRDTDFVLLVTEPTPFGLHDLALALDMVQALGIPHAVVVNRHDPDNDAARRFCAGRGVEILTEIPDDRAVAEAYARGMLPVERFREYRTLFSILWARIMARCAGEVVA